MTKIIEASELPLEEKVYLKKDFLGWRIVHPNKNPDGSWNWINTLTGGWRHLLLILFILALTIGMFLYMQNQTNVYIDKCKLAMEEPVKFCDGLGYYTALNKSNTPKSNIYNPIK